MLSSKGLKEIVTTVRPIIERQLDDAEQIAAFRNKVAESGGDWSALKALIKAQIQDERDETGDGKRVKKILDKAGFSTDYAALLGWSNMNEKNFSAEEDYDRETGEILDKREAAVEKHGLAGALSAALGVEVEIVRVHETRSDLGLNILTKHEDIRTAPETAEEISRPAALAVPGGERSVPSLDAGGVKMDGANHPVRSDEVSGHRNAKSGQATNTNSEKATVATQGEATAPTSDERVSLPVDDRSDAGANAGGDHVESIAEREQDETQTSNTGEGTACALPTNGVTLEYVPASGVKRLPFAHCFPELSKADYERLERDIASNRVQTPIIRRDDVIIDGWARYMISRQYGMSYPVQEYTGTDILLDVIELQRSSRNFTPAQEKKIAAELAKEIPHRASDIMAAFGLVEALEAAE